MSQKGVTQLSTNLKIRNEIPRNVTKCHEKALHI